MNYVKLITEAYFEVNTSTQYDFELKKELFQQILTRKRSVLEQEKHITEQEFLTQCGLALNKVRSHVIETLEFRENPRYDYLGKSTFFSENIFVDIEDVGGKSNRELSEDELNELEKLFGFIAMLYHKTNQPRQVENFNSDEVYKTQNLFKVGLLFAKGEMNKYYTINNLNEIVLNNGLSPLKIAKELGNASFEKIILASKNNYKNGENRGKNIFNNLDMMTKIILDCKAKNVPVEPYFISRLPIE